MTQVVTLILTALLCFDRDVAPETSGAVAGLGSEAQTPPPPKQPTYDELIKASHERLKTNDFKGAIVAVEEAIKLDGQRYEAYVQGAIVAGKMADNVAARMFLQRAIDRAPQDKRPGLQALLDQIPAGSDPAYEQHLATAKEALSKNLFAKAGAEFEKAWRLSPLDPAPALSAAAAFVKIEDYTRVGILLREALTTAPAEKLAPVKQAIEQVRSKLDAQRDAHFTAAVAALEQDKTDDALSAVTTVLAMEPEHLEANYLLALVHVRSGRKTEAAVALQRCVAMGITSRARLIDDERLLRIYGFSEYVTLVRDVFGDAAAKSVSRVVTANELSVRKWAAVLDCEPDPLVITDSAIRDAILRTGFPWRIRELTSNTEMVLIPPGEYVRGDEDDGPPHKVKLTKAFYLGRFEVLLQPYLAALRDPGAQKAVAKYPAQNVSYVECQLFLQYVARELRLPTDAEWEYACRAGTTGDAYGELDEIGWYDGVHAVGTKKANGFGVHDMFGNVAEWCADWFADHPTKGLAIDPTGPSNGSERVIRGWYYAASERRAAGRCGHKPDDALITWGFRLARTP